MRFVDRVVARTLALLAMTAGAALLGYACSATGSGDDDDGAGASGNTTNVGGGQIFEDGGFDAATDSGPCAAQTYPGELVPLDLYIMLDSSASMADGGKWDAVISALETFIHAPESDHMGVGIQTFPLPPAVAPTLPASCTADAECGLYGPCMPLPPPYNVCNMAFAPNVSCEPSDYDTAQVPIAELPGAAGAIQSALDGWGPNGDDTPTEPALSGTATYATAWATANPTHLTYIVFATDGQPLGCTFNSIEGAATVAANAAAGAPPVYTFVIGVLYDEDEAGNLDILAQAGGTGTAYMVDNGAQVTQQFIDALVEIRANGQCKFLIPEPETGEPAYDKVDVTLVDPDDPSSTQEVDKQPDAASCDPVEGGWYFDDPLSPNMVVLCPATCDKVREQGWDTQVVLACEVVVR
jgi:hypothetical protein